MDDDKGIFSFVRQQSRADKSPQLPNNIRKRQKNSSKNRNRHHYIKLFVQFSHLYRKCLRKRNAFFAQIFLGKIIDVSKSRKIRFGRVEEDVIHYPIGIDSDENRSDDYGYYRPYKVSAQFSQMV